jgi:hypothetical protein
MIVLLHNLILTGLSSCLSAVTISSIILGDGCEGHQSKGVTRAKTQKESTLNISNSTLIIPQCFYEGVFTFVILINSL